MSRVGDSNRYPRRKTDDIDTTHIYLQRTIRPPVKPIDPYSYYDLKTPADNSFIRKPDNFKPVEKTVIYPEDEFLNPPVYRQVIDQQKVNIAGKYFKRTDLTGKTSTR